MMESEQDEKIIKLNWILPDIELEIGEIERVILGFIGKEVTEENTNQIIKILESASLVDLSDENWQVLENTDSFNNVRIGHIEDAERITERYNLALPDSNKRNFKNLLGSFKNGNKMEAPIILKNKTGALHLLSGNNRLMISRALGIRPKVLIGEII